MKRKILIIGGAGYIGSITANLLSQHGHEIVICDNLSTGFEKNVIPQAKFHLVDMCDYKTMESIFSSYTFDLVINFAAKIIVPESVQTPNEYFRTNIDGMCICLQLMHKYNIKNIIFSSSAAVYGECDGVDLISEESATNPINPYGQTKLINEWSLMNSQKTSGINYVAFRFFNVAGAAENGNYGNRKKKPSALIPAINDCLLHNKEIKIYGNDYPTQDGTCLRDYVHVLDLANACLLAIPFLENNQSGIFNLGSGQGHTVKQVVDMAIKQYNPNHKVIIESRRPGDPAKLVTDNKLALSKLQWLPKKTILDMITSDYEFRKNNGL